MNGPAVRVSLCLALASSVFVASGDASACGGVEVMPAIDHRVMGVARAEQALRDGRLAAAAGSVIRMFPEIRRISHGQDPLLNRAFRVLAVAAARAEGALGVGAEVPRALLGAWGGTSAEDRRANIDWSIRTLQRLNEQRKNDPALQGDLGEALARAPERRGEALRLLGGLAERDLLASPEAYAALARLRALSGDGAGHDAAASRCEAMAKNTALCRTSGATGPQS
ncbi:hypothetical protein SOCEGT47_069380 [Sorangium cellulosum]|uniref:Secreted protein n=1 Tax=Sorangium cellulosum TaxID=56 RepID=A0A4P2Q9S0_SORCE|nr:hypothetical protein [Sorangium cellulosum]AUX26377.1 hypothetical protein SOCEGT47_069380 [Sorangium cellulosum]